MQARNKGQLGHVIRIAQRAVGCPRSRCRRGDRRCARRGHMSARVGRGTTAARNGLGRGAARVGSMPRTGRAQDGGGAAAENEEQDEMREDGCRFRAWSRGRFVPGADERRPAGRLRGQAGPIASTSRLAPCGDPVPLTARGMAEMDPHPPTGTSGSHAEHGARRAGHLVPVDGPTG